jgi:hypothetical protein
MNAIHAIEASDRSCFRVGAVSQRGPRKNRKRERYGFYNLTIFDVAALKYSDLLSRIPSIGINRHGEFFRIS